MQLMIESKEVSESISEYCYRIIKKNILYLHIKPGKSISENGIASALNVSRTPIRESFSRLLNDDLLEVFPQQGTYVPLIDTNKIHEAIFMRNVLEGAIIKSACTNFSNEDTFLLESNLNHQKYYNEKGDYEKVFELDNELHHLIYKGVGMSRIWHTITSISSDVLRIRYLKIVKKIRLEETIQEHMNIIEAIKNKDIKSGCKHMHEHVEKIDYDIELLKKQHPEFFKANQMKK